MATSRPRKAAKAAPKGKVVASVPGFFLVRPPRKAIRVETAAPDRAEALVSKAAKALNRPGISKDVVFKGRTDNVYSYSVDTSDITRIVRVSSDGQRSVGRLVGEKFVPIKTV
jgi:hypothetical protein